MSNDLVKSSNDMESGNNDVSHQLDRTYDPSSPAVSGDYEDDDLPSFYRVYGFESHPINAPKLIDLASCKVALALCNSNIDELSSNYGQTGICSEYQLLEDFIELIDQLPVPVSISKDIKDHAACLVYAFAAWIYNHLLRVFNETHFHYEMCNLFHFIVWYPYANGTIDLVLTARNLINSPKLSEVEKYRLLCTYCLKEELESMWPSFVSNGGIDHVHVSESNYPLIYYWNCYFGNNLDQMWRPRNQSLDIFMLQHAKVDNWPAKEYFFDRLIPEEQTRITISFIDRGDAEVQKALLRKLNKDQRLHVYANRAGKIIMNYASRPLCYAQDICLDICLTWFEVCNFITDEDFVSTYKYLLSSKSVDTIILEFIWFSAPGDFKNHLLAYNDHEIVGYVLRLLVEKNENDLFFKMMSECSSDAKQAITTKPFFIQCCADLICCDQLPLLDQLLNFCFENSEEWKRFGLDLAKNEVFIRYSEQLIIENNLALLDQWLNLLLVENAEIFKFKQDLSRKECFSEYCERLVTNEEFLKFEYMLNSFVVKLEQVQFKQNLLINSKLIKNYCLNCYSDKKQGSLRLNSFLTELLPSSPDFIIEYKKNLLMSSDGIDWCASRINSKFLFNSVIKDSLPTDDLVAEFKERLVFSPTAVEKFRKFVTSNHLNELDACIRRYITSNEVIIALKKRIVGNTVDLICEFLRINPNEPSWQSLMMWWPQDESSSVDFKSTLPLDEIFDQMLKDCIYSKYDPAHRLTYCKFRPDLRFDSLDLFLNWYFEWQIEITVYKLRRINAYVEIDAIKPLLKKRDNTHLKTVLNWIFDNDAQRLAEFKDKKKGEKIHDAMK